MTEPTREENALALGISAQKSIDKATKELAKVESKIAFLEEEHGITTLKEKKKELKKSIDTIARETVAEIASPQGVLFGAE